MLEMSLCHESQVFEWLPWTVGKKPMSGKSFEKDLRERHSALNKRYGMEDDIPREFFTFTKWGRLARKDDRKTLF